MANRGSLVVVVLLFIIFYSDLSPPVDIVDTFSHAKLLARERAALAELSAGQYGDFDPKNGRWVNLTGLRKEDGYGWDRLRTVQERWRHYEDALLGDNAEKATDGTFDGDFPVYHNITGLVRGRWVRSRLEASYVAPSINLSGIVSPEIYASHEWTRNITGLEGKVKLEFIEKERTDRERDIVRGNRGNELGRPIKAHLQIQDWKSWGDGWDINLFGIHYVELGAVLLTTTSEKFAGIFALPHLAPSEYMSSIAHRALNSSLSRTIKEHSERRDDITSPWSSTAESSSEATYSLSAPHCEFIIYLQQYAVSNDLRSSSVDWLQPVENELRFPVGYPIADIPNLAMTMVAFSPDCGFIFESKGFPDYAYQDGNHLQGQKIELLVDKARFHLLAFVFILAAQVQLTSAQMKEACTPSTRSRVSFNSIALMTMADGCVVLAFLPFSYVFDSLAPIILAAAFFAFLAIPFFGLRFLMDIYSVQAQENRRQDRQARARALVPSDDSNTAPAISAAQSTTAIPILTAAGADTLPLPAIARHVSDSGATPVVLPPDQDDTTGSETTEPTIGELRRVYVKYCMILMGTVMFSLYASSWPRALRSAYVNLLSFSYLSFWLPQIHRNVMRNCRKALLWRFVIGQSILRATPFIYFYAYPGNVLWYENDRRALLVLLGWQWLQVWLLWIQDILGPRIFVSEKWVPPAYDYHHVLRYDEEGASMPIGFTQSGNEATSSALLSSGKTGEFKDKTKRIFDCAICMQDIEVPIVSAEMGVADSSTLGANLLARRAYMVTPCRHIFHTPCLESWMRYRLQCPICRETLPPL